MVIIIGKCMKYMPVNKLLSSYRATSQSENSPPIQQSTQEDQQSTLENQQSAPYANHQNKNTSRSMWCLIFEVNYTIFLTNVSFLLIIALIYTSVLS